VRGGESADAALASHPAAFPEDIDVKPVNRKRHGLRSLAVSAYSGSRVHGSVPSLYIAEGAGGLPLFGGHARTAGLRRATRSWPAASSGTRDRMVLNNHRRHRGLPSIRGHEFHCLGPEVFRTRWSCEPSRKHGTWLAFVWVRARLRWTREAAGQALVPPFEISVMQTVAAEVALASGWRCELPKRTMPSGAQPTYRPHGWWDPLGMLHATRAGAGNIEAAACEGRLMAVQRLRWTSASLEGEGRERIETVTSVRAVERPESVSTRRTIGATQEPFMADCSLW